MLQLSNIQKFYNNRQVLDVPLLSLASGIYWVKGVNGSGKTTLLKIAAGMIPFDGEVILYDVSLKKNPVLYRRQIAWAEAEPLYPGFLSGVELIFFYRSILKFPAGDADVLIELLQMSAYIEATIGSYSAGMTKKLSLLLAFLGNPRLVILDEPLITLDEKAFTNICKLIVEKSRTNGTMFLISSHQEMDSQLLSKGRQLIVKDGMISGS